MTKKIFHSILLVAGTVLLASLLVIMGCLYEYFGSVEKKQLRDELELASAAVERSGTNALGVRRPFRFVPFVGRGPCAPPE